MTQNELVKELFSYLDTTEISDSGKEFHPSYISCSRVLTTAKLAKCLQALKNSIEENDDAK